MSQRQISPVRNHATGVPTLASPGAQKWMWSMPGAKMVQCMERTALRRKGDGTFGPTATKRGGQRWGRSNRRFSAATTHT